MNDKKEDTTKEMEEILKDLENESAKGGKMSHKDRFGKHSDDNNEKKDIDKDIDKGVIIQTKSGMAASSAINGKVLSVEMEYNKKYSVTLERKDGLKVKYALLTAVNVKKDSIVAEGDKIGETGEFMRFEVIVNNLSVDPMLFSYR